METLELFAQEPLSDQTSYVAGSPARTSATRASGPVSTASAADYGQSSPELLASYDPATSSWRTSQLCLDGDLSEFSETWPRSGLMRNGIAYRLPPLAPLTAGTECGSWPTPDAMVANDGEDLDNWQARRARVKAQKKNGNGFGMPLAVAVRLWPTPISSSGGPSKATTGNPRSLYSGNPLATAVNMAAARLWTTPTANEDACGQPGAKMQRMLGNHPDVRSQGSGGLNPTWVEWLMGYPSEWTALDASATPSCPRSRKSSGGPS